jgi:flagellar biosynthetic protein FliR
MPGELTISLSTLYAFLLVLIRVGGVFVFVPIPGIRTGPSLPRVVLSVGIAIALFPHWPAVPPVAVELPQFVAWVFAEATLGILVGLLVALLTETFAIGAQAISMPAGYTYASSIDPSTQAESNVLVILAQLVSGLLFFAFGLDREIIRLLALSLETYPPGTFGSAEPMVEQVIIIGSLVFNTGLRLVLPILILMAMVDISLALLGRLNSQLQVIVLSFPIKMLLSLLLLIGTGLVLPRLFSEVSVRVLDSIRSLVA